MHTIPVMLCIGERDPVAYRDSSGGVDFAALLARPAWQLDALCRDESYRHLRWITVRGEPVSEQKAVCGRCLVNAECRAAGIAGDELGVWGGTTGRERRAMRNSLHRYPIAADCVA